MTQSLGIIDVTMYNNSIHINKCKSKFRWYLFYFLKFFNMNINLYFYVVNFRFYFVLRVYILSHNIHTVLIKKLAIVV